LIFKTVFHIGRQSRNGWHQVQDLVLILKTVSHIGCKAGVDESTFKTSSLL